jgi:hypothetical protein
MASVKAPTEGSTNLCLLETAAGDPEAPEAAFGAYETPYSLRSLGRDIYY